MTETLAFGRRRRSRIAWAGAVLAVALAVSGWMVSDRRLDKERAELAGCASAADSTVDRGERRLAALASYIAPAVSSRSERTYERLYSLLSEEAEKQRPDVARVLDHCRRVDVWWVHREQDRRAAAYVALLQAELARLDRIAADGTTYHQGYDLISRLRAEAAQAAE